MKLGKTLVSFLSASMVVALAACGGGQSASLSESASESPSESGSAEPATRPWSAYERGIQEQYLKFVMPELPVPNDETTVFSFDGEELDVGYLNLQDAINIAYTPSDAVSEAIRATLTAEYGEPTEIEGGFEWEYVAGTDDCYSAYIDLDVSTGVIMAMPYTFTQKGMEFWMDNNMVKNDGTFIKDKAFLEEYPGFPQLSGSDSLETIYGTCRPGEEKVFEPIISICSQTSSTVSSVLARLEAAGWKVYHWARSGGGFNEVVYTKAGVSGGFITYDFGLASAEVFTFEFLSGYSNAKYGEDDPSWVDSSSVESSDSSSAS